jgi:hypothetical protein
VIALCPAAVCSTFRTIRKDGQRRSGFADGYDWRTLNENNKTTAKAEVGVRNFLAGVI